MPEPDVRVRAAHPQEIDCDLLICPVFEGDTLSDLATLDAATGGDISRAQTSGEFKPKTNELFVTRAHDPGWKATRVALVGVGRPDDPERARRLRQAAATAAAASRQQRASRVGVVVRGPASPEDTAQALAEGVLLGHFEDRSFKRNSDDLLPAVQAFELVAPSGAEASLTAAVTTGRILGEAANRARELANAPGNVLTPRAFADRAQTLAGEHGGRVEVLDETAIADLGMGLLLGVARGSAEPPRMIVMRHEPDGAPESPVLGLIGKGVTFDSGGISLKPPDGMERMKEDMAGGAAVICAMRAITALQVPIKVIALVPATENMPGGRAVKPGDILTSASGQTVEVLNTDAEGRLILGDALWYARQQGATHLVDVATLTGACVVALGHVSSGLFGQPSGWVEAIQAAAAQVGERVWPLPLYEEYSDQMKSEMADLVNSGGRAGGACTAAAFLRAFAGDGPWAHLDIAGTAWSEEKRPYEEKGATGVMVRTLTTLARTGQSW